MIRSRATIGTHKELLREIRRLYPESTLIVLTGYADKENAAETRDVGRQNRTDTAGERLIGRHGAIAGLHAAAYTQSRCRN
jgi:hypothetical protein